ncbi:probable 3',5'-cyclic phosphodiesterase pde-5 isoform X1 [Diabrotica virgifera virgifera]|uniref:Phosphodiesterase n=3 Tax=Diabrotica virgifera virgifera TaxID=50390 RepID=A0ABM5KU89_DIAVI|nr:probable 3',5'-cyclic phosphodiesterase pde-5 isoform X1 [Diabrotica virgifera virgifera]
MCSVFLQRIIFSGRRSDTSLNKCTVEKYNSTSDFQTKTMVTEEQVSAFLAENSKFLEDYIMNKIEIEQIERWIIRKSKISDKTPGTTVQTRKTSLSKWKFCVHADKRQMLKNLTQSLQAKPTQGHVLWELATCISSAVKADGFRLYVIDKENPSQLLLYLATEEDANHSPKLRVIKNNVSIPAYVAKTHEAVRFSRGKSDSRFPDTVVKELQNNIAHIQCQPITQSDGKMVGVIEMWRIDSNNPFYEEDEEIANSYLVWGGIALHYAQLYLNMNQQKKLNEFLLAVVKSIFQDMVSIDSLVIKIMNFAHRLVDADRASLFLVDSKRKELYATIFDVGIGDEPDHDPLTLGEDDMPVKPTKEIRFPLGTGIAGQVALTGEVLNIKDAYADPRFNRAVDQLTGYRTQTILCMPIYIQGHIIGVVQMVNKHKGNFTKKDEEAFETFAVYCGLALHHAKLYDKIRKSQQKYKVALDVLSYHNTCTEEEYNAALKTKQHGKMVGIDNYYFNSFDIQDLEKTNQAIHMFNDLFDASLFDQTCLLRFALTVKKNYRRVPYHNWTHGFSVANTIYCILKHSKKIFTRNECLALFVGALCHDLDHRGKNNKFMLDTESPLAAIYSTSTMEHHHFNQTVTILQQEGHNIFSKLSHTDYKQVLDHLKHCILATDLALFFPNRSRLGEIVEKGSFSWNITEHRRLIQAIAMTGSDLSASAKPWDIQVKTVEVIFEEFYDQGDEERKAGRPPIPMMDRYQPDQQPTSQVGFITGICIPCYTLLSTIIPETKSLLDMCLQNLDHWKMIDADVTHKQ